ncbi:MAG: trypsin-like peptidase domain-containing protein [Planctomycetes bacterium]|nr:trypsin-like peptidase domain-containing protein [Planctomycetota bacterium]
MQILEDIQNAFSALAEDVSPTVVNVSPIRILGQSKNVPRQWRPKTHGSGSGVIIHEDGYIITNNHVVADAERVEIILADGRRFVAKEIFLDPDTDLAVVRIDPEGATLPAAKLGDSDKVRVGDFVMAMGSPFGLEQTVTLGIVSYKGRQTNILGDWGFEDFIQTDADINHGNSGGPLVNLFGEVVGINSNIYSLTGGSAGLGFAIPSNIVSHVSAQLIAHKEVKRGWLGIRMSGLGQIRESITQRKRLYPDIQLEGESQRLFETLAKIPESVQGVLINEVMPQTPAQKAKLEKYDVILGVNGHHTEEAKDLQTYIAYQPPGETVTCQIWRDGKKMDIEVTLGDRDVAKAKQEAEFFAARGRRRSPFVFPRPKLPDERAVPTDEKPKLGIGAQSLTAETALQFGYEEDTRGVVIDTVLADSLADQNGLKVGDIIVSVDSVKIYSTNQLADLIGRADFADKGLKVKIRTQDGVVQKTIKRKAD